MTSPPRDSAGVWLARLGASTAARVAGAQEIEPAHLLIGLCELAEFDRELLARNNDPGDEHDAGLDEEIERDALDLRLRFANAGIDPAALRRRVRDRVGIRNRSHIDRRHGRNDTELLHRTPATRVIFGRAADLCTQAGTRTVTGAQLLRAVLEVPIPQWQGPAADLGVTDLLEACFPADGSGPRRTPDRVELEIVSGPLAGQLVSTTESTRWMLGRGAGCHVQIPDEADPRVSRFHAMVDVEPPMAWVRDMGSSNGTWLNDTRLPAGEASDRGPGERFPLVDGDLLHLADTTLRCRAPVQGPRPPRIQTRRATRVAEAPRQGPLPRPMPRAPRAPHRRTPFMHRCRVCADPIETSDPLETPPELCTPCGSDPDRIVRIMVDRLENGDAMPGLFGGYTLRTLLGAGGMGAVFLADDEQTTRQVALKIMLTSAPGMGSLEAQFRREADNAKQLRDRHILRQLEHGEWAGILYIVTEYCENGDLNEIMTRGPLSVRRAVKIAQQTLDALDHAHNRRFWVRLADGRTVQSTGLVHRDISPGNLLFREGILKVGDFGLSKAFGCAGLSGITGPSTAGGKPYFIPRRQLTDYREAGPEVDVWATAACLYYMLTGGEPPRDFEGHAGTEFQAVMERRAVPIRQRNRSVPQALADVIDHALEEEPRMNCLTAAELSTSLDRATGR